MVVNEPAMPPVHRGGKDAVMVRIRGTTSL